MLALPKSLRAVSLKLTESARMISSSTPSKLTSFKFTSPDAMMKTVVSSLLAPSTNFPLTSTSPANESQRPKLCRLSMSVPVMLPSTSIISPEGNNCLRLKASAVEMSTGCELTFATTGTERRVCICGSSLSVWVAERSWRGSNCSK